MEGFEGTGTAAAPWINPKEHSMSKLTTIEGIGPAVAAQFKLAGIGSVKALLESGGTPAGRRAISQKCGVAEARLLKYVNHADLMRVKGVGGEYAELLEAAGVDSVPELANRNPENLTRRMVEVNASRKLVRALPPAKSVTRWVAQAKTLPRAVHH
jgi:predicted flap endonuclease-1-like 5' DNA nuclease